MSQYVMEIGSTSLEMFRVIVGPLITECVSHVLAWEHRLSMKYDVSAAKPEEVMVGLASRIYASAFWRNVENEVRYVLIYSPKFAESNINLWILTIEYTSANWRNLWNSLGAFEEVRFACVCQEEGLILSAEQLSPETFPWQEPTILAAAVRSRCGEWITSREQGLL